jgi:hypothetical protein
MFQDENYPGLITIMNRFHTSTHQHEKQTMHFAVWNCVYQKCIQQYICHSSVHVPYNKVIFINNT